MGLGQRLGAKMVGRCCEGAATAGWRLRDEADSGTMAWRATLALFLLQSALNGSSLVTVARSAFKTHRFPPDHRIACIL